LILSVDLSTQLLSLFLNRRIFLEFP